MNADTALTLERFSEVVRPYLDAMLAGRGGRDPLAEMARIYPDRGGKLLRPAICLATGEALGVSPLRLARLAAAIELLHNGLLIHDDFEDASELRRGEPTMHRLLGPALAVHVGDALLIRAFREAFQAVSGSAEGLAAVAELYRAAATTEEGQTLDLLARQRDPYLLTARDYYEIVLKKTAAYTTVLPMRTAAAMANFSAPGLLSRLTRFALYCGLAFQIQDDLRSFGSSRVNGKAPAEDLLEGKVTLPLLRFFEVSAPDVQARASLFLSTPRNERKAEEAGWLSHQIVERGCIRHGQQVAYVAAAHAQWAWTELEPLLIPSPGTSFLGELPRMIVTHR